MSEIWRRSANPTADIGSARRSAACSRAPDAARRRSKKTLAPVWWGDGCPTKPRAFFRRATIAHRNFPENLVGQWLPGEASSGISLGYGCPTKRSPRTRWATAAQRARPSGKAQTGFYSSSDARSCSSDSGVLKIGFGGESPLASGRAFMPKLGRRGWFGP